MSCCTNVYNLGCFNHCDTIEFVDLVASETGVYTFNVKFAGQTFTLEQTIEIGDPLTLPLSNFNENAQIIVTITEPSGTAVTATIDDVIYDCFQIDTKIVIAL